MTYDTVIEHHLQNKLVMIDTPGIEVCFMVVLFVSTEKGVSLELIHGFPDRTIELAVNRFENFSGGWSRISSFPIEQVTEIEKPIM